MQKEIDGYHVAKQISIIVPVYNVEKYLRQCVDSLCMGLSALSCEIILVDDGSADHSASLCDAYAKKYHAISVIHQRHKGAAAARNAGIRAACGKYILFIDADDYVQDSAFRQLADKMEDCADLNFLQIQKFYPDGSVRRLDRMNDFWLKGRGKEVCIEYLAGLAKFPGSACAKMVKRQLILSNHIFFEEGMTAEDLVWTLKCILYASSFRFFDFPFYYYRQMRAGSVTSIKNVRRLEDLMYAIEQGVSLGKSREFCRYRNEIYAMMAYEAEVWLLLYGGMDQTGRIIYEDTAKQLGRLLEYRRDRRTMGIRYLVRLIGIRRAARIMHIFSEWHIKCTSFKSLTSYR